MDHAAAHRLVDDWSQDWNSRDVERVLSHFADDVVFTSPGAAQRLENHDGVVRGQAALRDYWSEGLRRIPDLEFTVLGVYLGVDMVVINYRNQSGGLVSEVVISDGPLVREGRHLSRQRSQPNRDRRRQGAGLSERPNV